jgi:hypothetical protein
MDKRSKRAFDTVTLSRPRGCGSSRREVDMFAMQSNLPLSFRPVSLVCSCNVELAAAPAYPELF